MCQAGNALAVLPDCHPVRVFYSVLQGLPSALSALHLHTFLPCCNLGAGEWGASSLIYPWLLGLLQIALVDSEGWLTFLCGIKFPHTVSSAELSTELSFSQHPSPKPFETYIQFADSFHIGLLFPSSCLHFMAQSSKSFC